MTLLSSCLCYYDSTFPGLSHLNFNKRFTNSSVESISSFSLIFCSPFSQNPYLAVSTNLTFHQRKTLHKFWCHLPCSETLPKLCWGVLSLTMVTFCFTLSRGFVGNVSGASLCQVCLSTQTSPNLIYKLTRTSYRSNSKATDFGEDQRHLI